jgi:hypothetical protein
MSDVFISYKSEDQARVGRLVQALEKNGLSVWWDHGLPGGEEWRANIERALAVAGCVVVVWTRGSVGPEGGFVRDEAARARARGILVPVRLDRVTAPLGFGELQVIDLAHWRANPRDPFLLDLVAAARAKLEGHAAPPAKGPMKRMLRRFATTSGVAALLAVAWGFGVNVLGVQDQICAVPLGQPRVSDLCGAVHLGRRPTRAERLAWEGREPGSCAGLRNHVMKFPDGVYRAAAADLIAARRVWVEDRWTPTQKPLALYVTHDATPSSTVEAAKAAALTRGHARAERLCRDFAASGVHRFTSAVAEAQSWECTPGPGRLVCGFDGRAVCTLEERQQLERESCESSAVR